MTRNLLRSLIQRLTQIELPVYIFFLNLIYYFSLWFINPGNKIIVLSFALVYLLYQFRFKNLRTSLIFTFFTSTIIFTGKSYRLELVPPGIYPLDVFPYGYVLTYVLSAQTILLAIIAVVELRDFITQKGWRSPPSPTALTLWVYTFWIITSDLFGSHRPDLSLLFSWPSILIPFLYAFVKKHLKNQLTHIVYLFAALMLVESIFAFFQYLAKSPLYKNIEAQVNIEYFGQAADEIQFGFRPVGTFSHANELGMWLCFWLSICLAYLYKHQSHPVQFSFFLGLVTTIMTLSRSAWLGLFLSSIFILYLVNKRAKIPPARVVNKYGLPAIIIGIVLIFIFVLPRAQNTFYTFNEGGGVLREEQITETLGLIGKFPIFGVGTNMQVLAGREANPYGVFAAVALPIHNWYLLIASEHGPLALFIFILFIRQIFKKIMPRILSTKKYSLGEYFSLGFAGATISLLVIGLFQPFVGEVLLFSFSGILDSG
jgi:hypothetical protein